MNLQLLKQLNLDRLLEMDEAVALSAEARTLEGEYETLGVQPPEWLDKATTLLRDEITRRCQALALAELKKVEAEIAGYKTVSEKKTDALTRLAKLQEQLGMTGKTSKTGKAGKAPKA